MRPDLGRGPARPATGRISMSQFTVTRTLKAPRDRVWQVLTQPSHFEGWLPAKPGTAVLDVRTGLFGYSLGAGIALNIITNHPAVVRKAVLASVTYDKTGLHPEMLSGPEPGDSADAPGRDLQIPFEQEYRALAPDPGNWPALLAKVQAMELPEMTPQAIAAIKVPILLIIGDSDIVTPEHAVAMFRLLGGGVLGDLAPMPATRFAVLPGTSHTGVTGRADMLMTMIPPFLDAP